MLRRVGLEVGSSAWLLWWVWRVFVVAQRGVGGGRQCLVVVDGNVNMLGPWKRRTAAAAAAAASAAAEETHIVVI